MATCSVLSSTNRTRIISAAKVPVYDRPAFPGEEFISFDYGDHGNSSTIPNNTYAFSLLISNVTVKYGVTGQVTRFSHQQSLTKKMIDHMVSTFPNNTRTVLSNIHGTRFLNWFWTQEAYSCILCIQRLSCTIEKSPTDYSLPTVQWHTLTGNWIKIGLLIVAIPHWRQWRATLRYVFVIITGLLSTSQSSLSLHRYNHVTLALARETFVPFWTVQTRTHSLTLHHIKLRYWIIYIILIACLQWEKHIVF